MLTNGAITIWHLSNEETGTYTRQCFGRVFFHKVLKVSNSNKALTKDNTTKIRIPTIIDINVAIGDYVYLGISQSSSPDRNKHFKITEISDNRIGANPHWRLMVE